MTSYIAIVNSEIDPNSGITADLMTKMRDNPIAMAEGASGAPRVYGAAMYGAVAGAVIQRNCLPFGNESATSSSVTKVVTKIIPSAFTAIVGCTVRLNLTCVQSGYAGEVRVYKNAAVVQTYTTNQTSTTLDVILAAGDCIAVDCTGTGTAGGATGTMTVSLLKYSFDSRSSVMT